MTVPTPYKIDVSDDQLSWINARVKSARIPQGKKLSGEVLTAFGLRRDVAMAIHQYWTTDYDWRTVEKSLNEEMKMFTLPIEHNGEELTIHFVHHQSERENAIPLLFIHGWPGSFLELHILMLVKVQKILKPLTSPASASDQAYHVIAPSLPGFGFSSYPSNPCSPMDMAAILNKLMLKLHFNQYMAQGGDWGSIIGRSMAIDFPEHCKALHINMVAAAPPSPIWDPLSVGKLALAWLTGGWNLSPFANRMFGRMQNWMKIEAGYSEIQGTKPQTISYALSDSPFGQVCWIRDKLDKLAPPEYMWKEEEVITWCMPYVINGSSGPAEIYKWSHEPLIKETNSRIFAKCISSAVPVGCSVFPYDVMYVPRWWAKSQIAKNIVFWKEHETGGHFASVEVPNILVADIRAFTRSISPSILKSLR